ncbi:MAG: hypothetical protein KKD39_03825, partial [Candidatus Altiarchaeota archaeon]|nr:hypothetical protein [Candidatus Altiarchaeota archaeon]
MSKSVYFVIFIVLFCGCMSETKEVGIKGVVNPVTAGTQSRIVSGKGYELLLPAGYDVNRSYPLVVCLDPGANGRGYVEYLRPLAEDGRWIIAGSTIYSNSVIITDFVPKVNASIEDIKVHYRVRADRVYLCGMSGGGMATYVMSYFRPNYFAGIIV